MSKTNATTAPKLNDGFDQPQEVNDIALAFGGDMKTLLPSYATIPDEFKRDRNEWVEFQRTWFFRGVKKSALTARPDVDSEKAFRHLSAIQGSWEPKHEHKEAAVAWLASRWFAAVAS